MNRILNPVGWEKVPPGTKLDDDTIVVKTNADTIVVNTNTPSGQKCNACSKPALSDRSRCGSCSRK